MREGVGIKLLEMLANYVSAVGIREGVCSLAWALEPFNDQVQNQIMTFLYSKRCWSGIPKVLLIRISAILKQEHDYLRPTISSRVV